MAPGKELVPTQAHTVMNATFKATLRSLGETAIQNGRKPSALKLEVEVHEIDAFAENRLSTRYAKWERLFRQDTAAPIALHPAYVFCELERQPAERARPAWLVKSVRGAQVETLAVLAPKTLQTRQMSGVRPNLTMHGLRLVGSTFVAREGTRSEQDILSRIFAELLEQQADFLLIEDLEIDSPMWKWLEAAPENRLSPLFPNGIQTRHRIRFPENPEDYWQKFSAVSRKTHRRTIKKAHPAEMVRITEPAQVDQFLTDVATISERTWQSRHLGTRITYNPGQRRLFEFLAEQGALRSYLLYHEGQPIAFEIATQHNGCFSSEESGYDMEFGNRSPGHALFLMMLNDMIAHKTPDYYDFGGGDAEYKQHYSNETSQSGSLLLFPPRLRSQLLSAYLRSGLSMTRSARYLLEKTGLRNILRRQVRRGRI